jgi:outer membrane protein assembly factor BamB
MSFIKNQLFLWVLFSIATISIAQTDYMKQWPQFRGPFASGIIDNTDLPDSWNIETGDNIKWKIDISGLGHSCPVIWDDKLFITTAISSSGTGALKVGLYGNIDSDNDTSVHEFKLYCINKNTGDIIWENTIGGSGQDEMSEVIVTNDGDFTELDTGISILTANKKMLG